MIQRLSRFVVTVGVLAWAQNASAQCATCGNPALTAGASDMGKALGEDVVEATALSLSLSYSFTNFDEFIDQDGNVLQPTKVFPGSPGIDDYFLALHVFVLNAEVSHPSGVALSLALPVGYAPYHNDRNEDGATTGIADIESRVRLDLNKLVGFWKGSGKPRLNLSLGGVAPTGDFEAAVTDPNANANSTADRYVSLGRGVPWLLANLDLRGYTKGGYGWYFSGGIRNAPMVYEGDFDYAFEWGNEYRLATGASAQLIPKKMGVSAGLDWNYRADSRSRANKNVDFVVFANGGGQDITGSLTLQGNLPGGVMASLGVRVPLLYSLTKRDGAVKNLQVMPDPNVFAGVAYRFGGSKVVKNAAGSALPKPNVLPGEVPKDPELLKLLGDNQVTIIDYWATWCVNCMKLMPYIDAWKKNNPHVTVAKMDATKWDIEAFKRFLPATPELPALDIYGADKKLIIRLGGADVFKFREHLPAGVDKGYPEGWEPPKASGKPVEGDPAKADKPQADAVEAEEAKPDEAKADAAEADGS